MNQEEIENIFRNSSDSDQLFDAFQTALVNDIRDVELYKILLGNPILSDSEIAMYAEKLSREIPESKFQLFIWTAELFAAKPFKVESVEKALEYFKKAYKINPASHTPLVYALNLYNYDFDYSINKLIIEFIETNVTTVKRKSAVYKSLANHYKKINNQTDYKKYCGLFEKAERREQG